MGGCPCGHCFPVLEKLRRLRRVQVPSLVLIEPIAVVPAQVVIIHVAQQFDLGQLSDVVPRFIRRLQRRYAAHVATTETNRSSFEKRQVRDEALDDVSPVRLTQLFPGPRLNCTVAATPGFQTLHR